MSSLTQWVDSVISLANRLIQLDPESRERLRALAGRVVAVEFTGLDQPLRVAFSHEAIVPAGSEAAPDVTVRGTPLALLSLALRRGQGNTGDVEFKGDVAVVHGVRALVMGLEIDWEEQLSRLTGDVFAHQAGNLARGLGSWLLDSGRTLEQNVGEYLTEEARLLPSEPEMAGFLSDVDRLRQDLDRLEARLERLEKKREGGT